MMYKCIKSYQPLSGRFRSNTRMILTSVSQLRPNGTILYKLWISMVPKKEVGIENDFQLVTKVIFLFYPNIKNILKF